MKVSEAKMKLIRLTSTAEGDHDISGATVDPGEPQRSDFGPNLQSFMYGVIDFCDGHVRCVVFYSVIRKMDG